MAELDLIPGDYRRRRYFMRNLFRFGVVCGGIIALITASHFALGHVVGGVTAEVTLLQEQQKITAERGKQLKRRQATRKSFQHQLTLLQGLRSGAAAEKMFITIDRALQGEEVWFLSWDFKRAGEVVQQASGTVNTGYFIVVPAGEGRKKAETWKIDTHMTIRGQARDHAALSRFVRRLIGQPEIQDVRVINSRLGQRSNLRVVEFDMAVVVNSGAVNG